jgi:hypothetical protein
VAAFVASPLEIDPVYCGVWSDVIGPRVRQAIASSGLYPAGEEKTHAVDWPGGRQHATGIFLALLRSINEQGSVQVSADARDHTEESSMMNLPAAGLLAALATAAVASVEFEDSPSFASSRYSPARGRLAA